MGISTISMAIFNSYVKLPEGMGEVMGYEPGISIKIGKSNVAGKCSN